MMVVVSSSSVFSLCAVFQSPWWSTVTLWGAFFSASLWKHTGTHTHTKIARSLLDANTSQGMMRGFLLTAIFLLPLVSSFWALICMLSRFVWVCLCVCLCGCSGALECIYPSIRVCLGLCYYPPVPQLEPGLFLYPHFCWCVCDKQ